MPFPTGTIRSAKLLSARLVFIGTFLSGFGDGCLKHDVLAFEASFRAPQYVAGYA